MAAFVLEPGERLLINDPHAKWMMTEMKPVSGTIRLTERRFVFEKPEHAYFSVFKFLFKKLGGEILFEIKRSEITEAVKIEAAKKSRLQIKTKYERPKLFETIKMDTIVGELNRTIQKQQND